MTTDTEATVESATAATLRRVADHLSSSQAATTGVALDVGILDVPHPAAPRSEATLVPIRLYRRSAIVGPRWTPGTAGPCPDCLRARWLALRAPEELWPLGDPHNSYVAGVSPYLTDFALDQLAQLVAVAASAPVRHDCADIWELDLQRLAVARHGLIPDSVCATCATTVPDSAELAEAELRLASRIKPDPDTHRLRPARDYDLPLEGLVNPVCGLIGSTAMRAYHCNATAPVSGFFQVRSKYNIHDMWWSGHGDGYQQSEILGILEGLERYAGQVARGKEPSVFASYDEVAESALDPRECGTYRQPFFDSHHHTHEPFRTDMSFYWVWGYSLRDNCPRLVPEQMVYYLDHRIEQKNFVQECSNGCATGSTVEEAVLYGILELMERDAFLLCWYGRAELPRIDPSTCTDPKTQAMLDRVDALGYEVVLLDMRVDLPVPVVMSMAVRRDGGMGRLCFAAGAGLNPEDAVQAALCEVASYVPGFEQRVTDRADEARKMVDDYNRVTELAHHALLYGLPEMAEHASFLFDRPMHSMQELYASWEEQRPRSDDLRDDVQYLLDIVSGLGSDVVVVDQTSPEQQDIGLRTVAVVAPGLVPIDFSWARQRVLDLPRLRTALVDGGLRDTPLTDADINYNPHPFP